MPLQLAIEQFDLMNLVKLQFSAGNVRHAKEWEGIIYRSTLLLLLDSAAHFGDFRDQSKVRLDAPPIKVTARHSIEHRRPGMIGTLHIPINTFLRSIEAGDQIVERLNNSALLSKRRQGNRPRGELRRTKVMNSDASRASRESPTQRFVAQEKQQILGLNSWLWPDPDQGVLEAAVVDLTVPERRLTHFPWGT
ncbi:hypothetical protein AWI43_14030 [Streptomyces sp. WAC04657]|nr:hypothetical protein AWI43_14030 [Streptomyces sp. WAC04657]